MILLLLISFFSWVANHQKNPSSSPHREEVSSVEQRIDLISFDPNAFEIWNGQPSHAIFDQLLESYVSDQGKVNYAGLKSDIKKLDAYLSELKNNYPKPDWTRAQQLAYWINAYNAFTIKLILNHYPVGSITDIDQGKPWDTKWIELGDKTYSLNHIENEIIRPQFKEPRIHFAVNCAARSCPPLVNHAFTPDNLEDLLDARTRAFVNDQIFNEISASSVSISKIFSWYADDFADLLSFLSKYSEIEINASADISFREYDWKLNNQ